MPRYFFDVIDSRGRHPDEHGVECDTLKEAAGQAKALLPHLAGEHPSDQELQGFMCEVRDTAGTIVYRNGLVYHETYLAALPHP